ncbi:hypothetical protein FHW13_003414 [Dokdonella fugitiva]|nr:hypothetical protein [Dokdonella fugitiva]
MRRSGRVSPRSRDRRRRKPRSAGRYRCGNRSRSDAAFFVPAVWGMVRVGGGGDGGWRGKRGGSGGCGAGWSRSGASLSGARAGSRRKRAGWNGERAGRKVQQRGSRSSACGFEWRWRRLASRRWRWESPECGLESQVCGSKSQVCGRGGACVRVRAGALRVGAGTLRIGVGVLPVGVRVMRVGDGGRCRSPPCGRPQRRVHRGVAVAHRVRSYGERRGRRCSGGRWRCCRSPACGRPKRRDALRCDGRAQGALLRGAAWRRLYGGCPLPRKRERGNGRCGQRAGVSVRLSIITRGAEGWSL